MRSGENKRMNLWRSGELPPLWWRVSMERGRKGCGLEVLKQPPGRAGAEEMHLSGVDFLQQQQQQWSNTPPCFVLLPPPPPLPHTPQSHLSLMALHPLFPSPISEQRGGASATCDIPSKEERKKEETKLKKDILIWFAVFPRVTTTPQRDLTRVLMWIKPQRGNKITENIT